MQRHAGPVVLARSLPAIRLIGLRTYIDLRYSFWWLSPFPPFLSLPRSTIRKSILDLRPILSLLFQPARNKLHPMRYLDHCLDRHPAQACSRQRHFSRGENGPVALIQAGRTGGQSSLTMGGNEGRCWGSRQDGRKDCPNTYPPGDEVFTL